MNTLAITDKLTQKVIDSKGTNQARCREIMGRNFFGVEEAITHFEVSFSKHEGALLADVPFTEETVTTCKYTHVLVAVFPLSILDIRRRVDRNLFSCRCLGRNHQDSIHEDSWYNQQAFAKDCGKIGWHLVRKTYVPDSIKKTWDKQQELLGQDEETPSARVLIYTIIGHFLSSGENRERLFEDLPDVRCSDLISPGRGVVVGGLDGALGIRSSDFSHDDRLCSLGVASARKL